MKKVYNQPSIEVVHLQPFRLMEGSPMQVSNNDFDPTTQSSGAKGGGFLWDDDESGDYGEDEI